MWEAIGFPVDFECDPVAEQFRKIVDKLSALPAGPLDIDDPAVSRDFSAHLGWRAWTPSGRLLWSVGAVCLMLVGLRQHRAIRRALRRYGTTNYYLLVSNVGPDSRRRWLGMGVH